MDGTLITRYVCSDLCVACTTPATTQDELVSRISRKSIDALKENFRDELSREDWQLVVKLKHMFQIN